MVHQVFKSFKNYISFNIIYLIDIESISNQFDICIWMGDFNYRVDLELDKAKEILEQREIDIEYLLERDQFSNEQNNGFYFDNFFEGKIEFLPTYKYKCGTEYYNYKTRIPSWTDRIIYKSKQSYDLIQLDYQVNKSINISDHKPVYSIFMALVKEEREEIQIRNSLQKTKEADDSNNEKSSLCQLF